MAHAGQEIEGWRGMRLRFVRTAADTGEVFEVPAGLRRFADEFRLAEA